MDRVINFHFWLFNHGDIAPTMQGAFPESYKHFVDKWFDIADKFKDDRHTTTADIWIHFIKELSEPNKERLFEYIDRTYCYKSESQKPEVSFGFESPIVSQIDSLADDLVEKNSFCLDDDYEPDIFNQNEPYKLWELGSKIKELTKPFETCHKN